MIAGVSGPEERDGGQVTRDPPSQRERVPVPARQPYAQSGGWPRDGSFLSPPGPAVMVVSGRAGVRADVGRDAKSLF
jgi:hypothetical protein